MTYQSWLADVSLGQFEIPLSLEGMGSSTRPLLPERALVSREFGDRRDLGLRAAKTFARFGYVAGVWNGAGAGTLDGDRAKDVALRLEAYPAAGLVLAGAGYATVGRRRGKQRLEADVRFERGPLMVQAEYIWGRDRSAAPAARAHGFYAAGGLAASPALQLVARVGHLDPDLRQDLAPTPGVTRDEVWQYGAGLNWFLHGHEVKLQLAYEHLQFDDLGGQDDVILAAQVAY